MTQPITSSSAETLRLYRRPERLLAVLALLVLAAGVAHVDLAPPGAADARTSGWTSGWTAIAVFVAGLAYLAWRAPYFNPWGRRPVAVLTPVGFELEGQQVAEWHDLVHASVRRGGSGRLELTLKHRHGGSRVLPAAHFVRDARALEAELLARIAAAKPY